MAISYPVRYRVNADDPHAFLYYYATQHLAILRRLRKFKLLQYQPSNIF